MAKLKPAMPWNLPPTHKQHLAIGLLVEALGYHYPSEEKLQTRRDARNMIMGFRQELKNRNNPALLEWMDDNRSP